MLLLSYKNFRRYKNDKSLREDNLLDKGTPASTFANIAFVAIEDVKVIGKMMSGELTAKEGIEKIEQTTVATVAGLPQRGLAYNWTFEEKLENKLGQSKC